MNLHRESTPEGMIPLQPLPFEQQPNPEDEGVFETPNAALACSLPINHEEIQYVDIEDEAMLRRIEWGEAWLRAAIADGRLDLSSFCREGEWTIPPLIDEYERMLQPTMRKAAELIQMEKELPGLRAELSEAREALRLLADQMPAMNQLLCHVLQQLRATEAKLRMEEQKSHLFEQQLKLLIPESGLPNASEEEVAVKKEQTPSVDNVGFRPYRPEQKKGGAAKKNRKIYRPY